MLDNCLKPDIKNVSCPLCGTRGESVSVYDLRNVQIDSGLPGLILRCTICGMTYKNFTKNISQIYDKEYCRSYAESEYMSEKNNKAFFDTILCRSKYYSLQMDKKVRLLDIGTGTGALLERATALGFEAHGVELCPELVTICRKKGLKVTEGNIEHMQLHKEFEVVTMCDIIEHLSSPLYVLKRVKELLGPKGELIIYTPNHDAPIVWLGKFLKFLGSNRLINILFAGNHVSFFDDKTIVSVLDEAGFSLKNVSFKRYSRPGISVSRFVLAIISIVEGIGCCFGQHGFRMFIFAETGPEAIQNMK